MEFSGKIGFDMQVINLEELRQALADAPDLSYTYVRQELRRFVKRTRKKLIRERMSGRRATGPKAKSVTELLHGGQFTRGKHINAEVKGNKLEELWCGIALSRILRVHEVGATITPRQAPYLFLSRKRGKAGAGAIFARRRSVTIPPRLEFRKLWWREVPDGVNRVHNALRRAMQVAFERRMRRLGNLASQVANL